MDGEPESAFRLTLPNSGNRTAQSCIIQQWFAVPILERERSGERTRRRHNRSAGSRRNHAMQVPGQCPGMNRRTLLGSAAAVTATAAALPMASGSAQAQVTVPKQANAPLPGVFRYQIGSFELTTLFDGYGSRPLDDKFIINAPLDQVQAAAKGAFRPTDTLKLSYTPTV